MMKERPILMTPENAQKCHDGTKTQTRRLNGLEEINEDPGSWTRTFLDIAQAFVFGKRPVVPGGHRQIQCPYGVVGDRLWVREAYCCEYDDDCIPIPGKYFYKGTGVEVRAVDGDGFQKWRKDGTGCSPWIPSIHMPRFACRTVLEITEIRVERLQEISEEDARAEGIQEVGIGAVHDFMILWESINGQGSWELNPWVWVIAFKKVRTE